MNPMIKELKHYNQANEKMEHKLPRPVYLYIARFGRGMDPYMNEITRLYGEEFYISYNTVFKKNDNLIDGFSAELERNTRFGETWRGIVFIHFTGKEDARELLQLCECLVQKQDSVLPVFITDQPDFGKELEEISRNYFFVRMVQADNYEKEELLQMMQARIGNYGYQIEAAAQECMEQYIGEKEWGEDEKVETQICGMIDNLIFGKMIHDERIKKGFDKKIIYREDLEEIFVTQKTRQHTVGFVLG
ncbi:MAG: hypothetical protein PUD20_05780 [bacterium]|nr:hypothetical protein [bacterium]